MSRAFFVSPPHSAILTAGASNTAIISKTPLHKVSFGSSLLWQGYGNSEMGLSLPAHTLPTCRVTGEAGFNLENDLS